MRKRKILYIIALLLFLVFSSTVYAGDSKETRLTLTGLQGVYVTVEELQPNMARYEKYLRKSGLSRDRIRQEIEERLRQAGIRVLTTGEWLKTTGRPVLYLNINTHETEKYWIAYDIRIEVQQIVSMDSNPKIKTLASTWSMNVTGIANIGTLKFIRDNVFYLVDKFVNAYKIVNSKRGM